jgi:two-component system response regulator AtoC
MVNQNVNHSAVLTTEPQTVANCLALPQATEALERRLISEALAATHGNKSKAAKLLEISERSLWYKLSQYQMS